MSSQELNYETLLNLAMNYGGWQSEDNFREVASAMSFDDLADFVGHLLTGDWSRNITVLDKYLQQEEEVIALFEYIDNHF